MKLPVLLIAFNRPATTKKVLEAIAHYFPDELYVAVDGPRGNKSGEAEKVEAVRELPKEGVHARRIIPLFQEKNHGCRLGVPLAITAFFQKVEVGVILEDDCVPNVDFWSYMEFALNHFADDMRVGHINGNSFLSHFSNGNSFYYSRLNHVWGWGSWRRAWEGYSVALKESEESVREVLQSTFPGKAYIQDWWFRHIKGASTGEINTWDYQWTYTLWKEGQVCITPKQNLVVNIGFHEDATHTVDPNFPGSHLEYGNLKPPYKVPALRIVQQNEDYEVMKSQYRIEAPAPEKISKKIKRHIKQILGLGNG